jgi:alpha-tubulin suppressor-like RCC1 family protein
MHIHTHIHIYADVTAIAAGDTHSMLLKKDGTVWATGENYQGQLGDGTKTWRWTYMKVVLAGQCKP